MCPTAARALPALLLALCALSQILTAHKPLHPRNVKLTSVEKGLKVTWDPPTELDGRPVDRYSIGYGKSMRSLRFIKVDKDHRSEVLEDVEPGVLHILKISSENGDGKSKPVYRAETPEGGELVKLDGFAVEGGPSINVSSPGRRSSERSSSRPPVQRKTVFRQRAPESSSGPEAPRRGGYLSIRSQDKQVDLSQPQADQRNANKPKLASESVYVVSLQAPKAPQRNIPASKTENPPPEHVKVEEVEDVTVRILSPQSVAITWMDPLVKKQKSFPEGSRKYTVRYREKGESARWEYKETSQRRLVIEKLSADGMYEFSVQITQGEEHGKWSVSIFQRTPESAPAGPPENFEVKPLRGKGTAVTATWDPPDEPNGKIREYILSYAPAMKPFGAKSVTYRGTTTSATIDGLTPGDRYIFKIRAVNRKGQGPQSKTLSVAMPETSTTASRHSTQSKSLSKTSVYDDLEDDDTQDTGESHSHTTTSPPTNKKFRPLSQTRSYHSIFSSVRGSVRNSGSNSKTATSSDKEEDDEETQIDKETQTEGDAAANEAAEDTQPEVTNNAPIKTKKEEQHKVSPEIQASSSVLKGLSAKNNFVPPKFKEGNHQSSSQLLTPHTSSVVSGSRSRRPPLSTSWSRTRNQNGASSSLPSSQNPIVAKKGHTSLYPDGKASTKTKVSTPSPEETKMETDRESSSSMPSAEIGRVSTPATHTSNSGSGPVHPSSRRIPQTKSQRYQTGRQKTLLSSFVLSSSKALTGSSTNDQITHSTMTNAKLDAKNYQKIKIPKKENLSHPSYQYTTTFSTPIKKEKTQDNDSYKDKLVNSYLPSTQIPSTASPKLVSSLFKKNSRIVVGSSQRKDGRIPWIRTASSVGAGRPILREIPSNPIGSKEHVSGKTKTTTYSTKHLVNPILAKPTIKSQQAAASNVRITSNYEKEDTQAGNNHKHDYLSEASKETHAIGNKNPTVPPKTIASHVQRSGQTSDNNTHTSYKTLNRLGLGSNGKVRSALLASSLNEFRLRGRLPTVQNTPVASAAKQNSSLSSVTTSSSSYASQTMDNNSSTSDKDTSASQNANVRSTVGLNSRASLKQPTSDQSPGGNTPTDLITSLTVPARNSVVRSRYPSRSDKNTRGKISLHKPAYGQGNNGRPNLTAPNSKVASTSNKNIKGTGLKHITGPDGSKWIVDLDKGVLMNEDGKVLQDSRGRPRKVVLGEDGKTIFDEEGSPLVNQDGMALFAHGRDSRPVVNPKEKFLTVGGKPLVGLDRPTPKTTTTTTTTTATTITTTYEPTTTEITSMEYTTEALPTCPPGTFSKLDKNGIPMMDDYGILDCYPSDEFLTETTTFPSITQLPTTTYAPTNEFRLFNNSPIAEFDAAGKKRFTAPYVNYIQKDPGAPCSLTEALEYLQVDVLAGLIQKDSNKASQKQPPKFQPHNITVIAMEGCHSFVILDWDRPLKDDMVSGYMVHSASYDDILNNRWSSSLSSGTHLAVENLKPNSRYYFRVQAKNVYGLGPISETISYVTESDDPLLIERPPGGEPIWIPFTFRYNPAHSSCKGSQYVKRTWYRKFVGVVLCNSLRYKIFMGDGLKETFYSIADSFGSGEDHCQFVDSHRDGRTGPQSISNYLPQAQGFYRSYRQEPVNFGAIGRRTPHQFVGWYECGVPIPGKW